MMTGRETKEWGEIQVKTAIHRRHSLMSCPQLEATGMRCGDPREH